MAETAEKMDLAGDRRCTIRYKISADVEMAMLGGSISARATEISIYGLRLCCPKTIYPGTDLLIRFTNLNDLSIKGQVIWVLNTINDLGLNFYEAGIFIDKLILRNRVASGLAARTDVMPDILLAMKENLPPEEEAELL